MNIIKKKKILIVVPNHYPFVVAWCLEYLEKINKDKFEPVIYNLAWINWQFLQKPWRRVLDNYLLTPSFETALSRYCYKNNIEYRSFKSSDFKIGRAHV